MTSEALALSEADGAVSLLVRVTPRARQSQVMGIENGVLLVRLQAPPVEGRANEALCAFLAQRLGVRQSAVSIAHGERSRSKRVHISGVSPERVREGLVGRELQQSSEKQERHTDPARRKSQHAR
jgi:uncharacterized protein (TIGR00251 family)